MIKNQIMKIWAIGVMLLLTILFQDANLASAKDPDYPSKPITLYIQFGAGGTADICGRAFGDAFGKYLGQPLIPVNRPGAGGTHAAMAVMTAKPDGYTLGIVTASNAFVAPFSGEAPYKDLTGFTMVGNFGHYTYVLMVRADAPWKTWKEFIEWSRKNPRGAKIGNVGAKLSTSLGLVTGQVEKREQVEFTNISFKSNAEILTSLLGGHINAYVSPTDALTIPYITEGKLRILVYLGVKKLSGYENIPSTHELYGFSIPNLLGIFGPKGLPDYVLKKLDDTFPKAVKDPDFIGVMNRMHMPIDHMNRAQMSKYVEEVFPKVGETMKMLKEEDAKQK
jgi:tripartite-type tricarboxylate transporter receptor subunit TctC